MRINTLHRTQNLLCQSPTLIYLTHHIQKGQSALLKQEGRLEKVKESIHLSKSTQHMMLSTSFRRQQYYAPGANRVGRGTEKRRKNWQSSLLIGAAKSLRKLYSWLQNLMRHPQSCYGKQNLASKFFDKCMTAHMLKSARGSGFILRLLFWPRTRSGQFLWRYIRCT